MQAIMSRLERVSPVWLAFFASLLLSLIAVSGETTVAKDAAFYLDVAKQAAEEGFGLAQERFNWPWFALLLAVTHKYLGLPLELAAYGWCALLMAGTCALVVDCVRRKVPEAAWWACLVVLAMPAFNDFRDDILREFGFWFFTVLTIWLALNWDARGGWLRLLALFFAVFCAALFRLEALFLLPALALWQLPGLFSGEKRWRALQLYFSLAGLLAIGALGLLMLIELFDFPVLRLAYYAQLLNPSNVLVSFSVFTEQFANSMTYKFSREEAGQIVFFGLVASVLYQAAKLLGPFALLLFYRGTWGRLSYLTHACSLFAWAALMYFSVLLLFFMQEQFITTRYLSLLNLLLVPLVAVAAYLFAQRFPRWGRALAVLGLIVMLANVVSFSARKTHYVDTGHWLKENVQVDSRVYYDDLRVSYYAGFGYDLNKAATLESALEAPQTYDYLVIEADGDEPWLTEWLERHQLRVLASFANKRDDRVLVIGK